MRARTPLTSHVAPYRAVPRLRLVSRRVVSSRLVSPRLVSFHRPQDVGNHVVTKMPSSITLPKIATEEEKFVRTSLDVKSRPFACSASCVLHFTVSRFQTLYELATRPKFIPRVRQSQTLGKRKERRHRWTYRGKRDSGKTMRV